MMDDLPMSSPRIWHGIVSPLISLFTLLISLPSFLYILLQATSGLGSTEAILSLSPGENTGEFLPMDPEIQCLMRVKNQFSHHQFSWLQC